jgi:hypothetical protein
MEVGVADNYKDFDASVEEDTKDELTFVLSGKEYSLPGQIPARVILTQMRYMDESGVVPTSVIPEWLESLLGKQTLEEVVENGATWPQLEELLNWLLDKYGIATGEGEMETADDQEGQDSPK